MKKVGLTSNYVFLIFLKKVKKLKLFNLKKKKQKVKILKYEVLHERF